MLIDRNKLKLLSAGAFSGALGRTAVSPLYRTTVLFQVRISSRKQYKQIATGISVSIVYKLILKNISVLFINIL